LRALYFLLADMHSRFRYLQQGLAIILAFVGIKMIIAEWYHIPTALSLTIIALVLTASIGFSLKATRLEAESAVAHRAFEEGAGAPTSDVPVANPGDIEAEGASSSTAAPSPPPDDR
jgi:tellurite resistance protein TerC